MGLKERERELINSWPKSAAYTTARAKSANPPPNLLLPPPLRTPPVPSRTMPGELDRLGTVNHEGGEAARAIMIIMIQAMGVVVGGKGIVKGKARHRERDGNRGMRMRSSRHRRRGGVMMVGGRERLEALFRPVFSMLGVAP